MSRDVAIPTTSFVCWVWVQAFGLHLSCAVPPFLTTWWYFIWWWRRASWILLLLLSSTSTASASALALSSTTLSSSASTTSTSITSSSTSIASTVVTAKISWILIGRLGGERADHCEVSSMCSNPVIFGYIIRAWWNLIRRMRNIMIS